MVVDLVSVIALIIGAIATYQGGTNWYKYHKIASLPVSKISGLKNGQLAKIYGKATGKILKSPFTETECVFYKITIEEDVWWKIRAFVKYSWDYSSSDYYYLESSDTIVKVDSTDLELIPASKEWSSECISEIPESIIAFEKEKHISSDITFGASIARTILRVLLVLLSIYVILESLKSFIQQTNFVFVVLIAAFGWYVYKKGVVPFLIKKSLIDRPSRTFKEFTINYKIPIFVVGELHCDTVNNPFILKKSSLLGGIVCYPQDSASSLDSLKLRYQITFLFGLALLLYSLSNLLV